MVLTEPALVVPDDLAWTLWGADPYADGLRPVSDAGSAHRTPSAWRAVLGAASGQRPERPSDAVAAVELERAVSHVAWLRTLARLLGWAALVDGCTAALAALAVARRDGPGAANELDRSLDALASLRGAVRGRRMAVRTRGRAVVDAETVAAQGLAGPVARAAGHAEDARSGDAAYAALGFAPVVEHDGDARARTILRHAEAVAAVELAGAALARAEEEPFAAAFADGAGGWVVEGPRGPLRARREDGTNADGFAVAGTGTNADGFAVAGTGTNADGFAVAGTGAVRCSAVGTDAVRTAAARSAVGQEWAGALVCLVSFDLSPGRVGE